jgi:type VI protein secretion system component Hcp
MIEILEARTLFAVTLPEPSVATPPPQAAVVDGGDAVSALRIKLTDVLVSGYQAGGTTGKVSQQDFHFVMRNNSASPTLGKVSQQDFHFVMKYNKPSPM